MSMPQLQSQSQGQGEGSFSQQVGSQKQGRIGVGNFKRRLSLVDAVGSKTNEVNKPFKSKFAPTEMRQLALVAHNHMKPAMNEFIKTYSEILKKFRITGTETTMMMCKSLWGEDDPSIHYGLTCTSGPLGGDAQIASLMTMEDLGGLIFFVDPLSAHPHQADIDSLLRLANCGNIIVCPNPASASTLMHTLRAVLLEGDSARGMIPSFFETMESPAVEEYKYQQAVALANVIKGESPSAAAAAAPPHPAESEEEKKVVNEGESDSCSTSSNFKDKDDMKEAPVALEQGESEKRKAKRTVPALSERTIDRALLGESMVFGSDVQDMLLSELNGKDGDYSKEDEKDAGTTQTTTAAAPVIKHTVLGMPRQCISLDLSAHPHLLDISSHPHLLNPMTDSTTHLGSVPELNDEDNDSLDREEDEVVAAPIALTTTTANTDTGPRVSKGLFGFVKKLRKHKAARMGFSLTLPGGEQERPSIVQLEHSLTRSSITVKEREKSDSEAEMLMLALKQQMELVEILKNRHKYQHS